MYSTIFQSLDNFWNFIKTFEVKNTFRAKRISCRLPYRSSNVIDCGVKSHRWRWRNVEPVTQLSVMSSPKAGNFGSFTVKTLMWLQILILGGVPKWDLMNCTISLLSLTKKKPDGPLYIFYVIQCLYSFTWWLGIYLSLTKAPKPGMFLLFFQDQRV